MEGRWVRGEDSSGEVYKKLGLVIWSVFTTRSRYAGLKDATF